MRLERCSHVELSLVIRSLRKDSDPLSFSSCSSLKMKVPGAPFSSVGRARAPCAEALQWTRVRLPARIPLLRVTLPLSCHVFSFSINKAMKGQKQNIKKKMKGPFFICGFLLEIIMTYDIWCTWNLWKCCSVSFLYLTGRAQDYVSRVCSSNKRGDEKSRVGAQVQTWKNGGTQGQKMWTQ